MNQGLNYFPIEKENIRKADLKSWCYFTKHYVSMHVSYWFYTPFDQYILVIFYVKKNNRCYF